MKTILNLKRIISHIIYLTPNFIKDSEFWIKHKMKKYAIKEIHNTLRHELIHAFVFEEFETLGLIKNTHSWLFSYFPKLSIVLDQKFYGHPYVEKFLTSDLGKQSKKCKNYDELKLLLINYIFEYRKVMDGINEEISPCQKLDIMFNYYGAGVKRNFMLNIKLVQNIMSICSIK